MKGILYETIIERFCFENFYFKNVRIEKQNGLFKSNNRDFDLVIFNTKKIILVARVDNYTNNKKDVIITLRAALNSMVNKLSLSLSDFILCGANDENFFFLNKYNDNLSIYGLSDENISKIIEPVKNELSYSSVSWGYDFLKKTYDSITFSNSTKELSKSKAKVQTNANGTVFVNRHGVWREASELNTETLYMLAAFGGMFGLHLFYQKKRAKGIGYLLTFGLFGICFFDCIEILLGMYKDPDGKYLVPLENKLAGFVMMLFGVVVFCVVGFLFLLLYKYLIGAFSGTISFFG